MLSLPPGIVTSCLWNNLLFEILVSLRYNNLFEDARTCKFKCDWLILKQNLFYSFGLVNRHPSDGFRKLALAQFF